MKKKTLAIVSASTVCYHMCFVENEIFVDVIERLTVVFNPDGYILTSEINGNAAVYASLLVLTSCV